MYAVTSSGRDSRGAEVVIIICQACRYFEEQFTERGLSKVGKALRPVRELAVLSIPSDALATAGHSQRARPQVWDFLKQSLSARAKAGP